MNEAYEWLKIFNFKSKQKLKQKNQSFFRNTKIPIEKIICL